MENYDSLRFSRIDSSIKSKLDKILVNLPVTSNLNKCLSENELVLDDSSSFEQSSLLDAIVIRVVDDFEENKAEFDEEGITFDYLITNHAGVVQVLTCLKSSDSGMQGEIQYGMTALRESHDKYLLWAE